MKISIISHNSGISNLSDDLIKTIVFFSIELFTSSLYATSPYRSKLFNLSSDRADVEPIISLILSKSAFRICE